MSKNEEIEKKIVHMLSSNLLFYCLDTKRLFSRFLRKNIGPIKGKSQENLFIFNYQTLPEKKFPAVRFLPKSFYFYIVKFNNFKEKYLKVTES